MLLAQSRRGEPPPALPRPGFAKAGSPLLPAAMIANPVVYNFEIVAAKF